MTDRIIPLLDLRTARLPLPAAPGAATGEVSDQLSRPLRDLRISVTDRCNFRCTYCMPKEIFDRDYRFLPHAELLTFEEITRLTRAFIANGVEKIRLTGGEPLLRKDVHKLIAMLSGLSTRNGSPLDLALTTNGSLLTRKARELADAGLRRVTVSLDGLDDAVFRRMNDVDFPVATVLAGIDAAAAAGLGPVKVNMVVKRGVNDQEIVAMARHFRGSGHIVRFIEFMDVGSSNGWRMYDVVPSAEVIRGIAREVAPLDPIDANYAGEVAERWRYRDGSGEIGVISSVTQAFCRTCTRARLSTEGMLYLCLFADSGYDLRRLLREHSHGTVDDAALEGMIARIWSERADRYSEVRTEASATRPKIEMSYIGG
jgi:cyclic pyranopterin phosphate synthase